MFSIKKKWNGKSDRVEIKSDLNENLIYFSDENRHTNTKKHVKGIRKINRKVATIEQGYKYTISKILSGIEF